MTDDPMHARFRAELRRTMLDTPVARWMETHRGELAQLLHTEVDWGLVARHMADHGLRDLHGRPPAAETVRLTWQAIVGENAPAAGGVDVPVGRRAASAEALSRKPLR